MWIVKLALNRPYTFIVAAILILVLGFSSIVTTPTDIFPDIDIPVVTIIWTYSGLSAKEMEGRITTLSEFVMAVVNDVKSIDSQTKRIADSRRKLKSNGKKLIGRQTLYCLSGLNADPARTEAQQPPLPTFWMHRYDGAGPVSWGSDRDP